MGIGLGRSEADARAAAVGVDEHDAGGFKCGGDGHKAAGVGLAPTVLKVFDRRQAYAGLPGELWS